MIHLQELLGPWAEACGQKLGLALKILVRYLHRYLVWNNELSSHMSGALDGTEKSKAQKLGHPMLVQLILSQKNQKSKFFNEQFFCNWMICIFPYIKLEAKWWKNGSLCAVNCLILIKTALNSLLNKHWHEPKPLRIQSCSFQWKYVSKIGFILQFFVII